MNGPPFASICIRANWKVPGVMNRYMRYESAGDEFVGRSVCGRARLGKRFAESCPYFDFSDCDEAVKALRMQELDDWIEARLPRDCDAEFFVLFKFCLASFIFHRQWLDENPLISNAIRLSLFWAESIQFSSCVVTKFPWNKTDDTPGFTGLPTDVLYMAQIELLKIEISELKSQFQVMMDAIFADNSRVVKEVCSKMEQELDLQSVGCQGYSLSRAIDRKIDLLISRLDSPPEVRPSAPCPQAPDDEEGDTLSLKHVTSK